MAAVDHLTDDMLDAAMHDPGWRVLLRELHHIPGAVIAEALTRVDWETLLKMPKGMSEEDIQLTAENIKHACEEFRGGH